jgi:hypothetical protein
LTLADANFKVLMELMAAKRSAAAKTAIETRWAADTGRNACVSYETKTAAEKKQEIRNEAEAIRVANGGAPAQ